MSEKAAKTAAPRAPAFLRPMTMTELLADMERNEDEDVAEVGELAPLRASVAIARTPRTMPVEDLATLARLWMLMGEGNSGKTMFARYLLDRLERNGVLDQIVVGALAPGNRNLTQFVGAVMQPPSTDPRATADYARKAMAALAKGRRSGVFDFGGGDASVRHLVEAVPNLALLMEDAGLALVAAYALTPRAADLTFLKTYERLGFQPRATVLLLNLARAETPASFDGLRRQPEYKAAIARGAVEVWIPAMPQDVALRIERAQVHFSQARDGTAPEGRKPAGITLLERVMVREWMDAMDAELRVLDGWMPWA